MKKSYVYIIIGAMSGIIIILTILCILFATHTIEFKEKTKTNNKEETTTTTTTETTTTQKSIYEGFGENDTFSSKNESGQADVIGYAYTKTLENFESDSTVTYVYFKIKETKSNELLKYINGMGKNSFIDTDAIGIGCLTNEKIIGYYNVNDEDDEYVYRFSKEDTDKILNSNESNLIRLKVNKKKLTYGGGASSCYSHITNIEIYN